MKAEAGCVCAGEDAPGPYSTSTPFMLLPGTLGSARSKTTVTFLAGPSAQAGVRASVARRMPLASRVSISYSWVDDRLRVNRYARASHVSNDVAPMCGLSPLGVRDLSLSSVPK